MTNPKVIIFDLDGTLIHSAPDLHSAINAMLNELKRAPLCIDTVISFIGDGVDKLVERSLRESGGYNTLLKQKALVSFMAFYSENMTTLTRPYPNVVSALQFFQNAGIPLGICTNKPTKPAQEICDRLDLTRFFNIIAGAENGQAKKPNPTPLLNCIKKLGAQESQALYVGDSSIDFYTALNATVPFRLFSKGYLNEPLPDLSESDTFHDWKAHGIQIS